MFSEISCINLTMNQERRQLTSKFKTPFKIPRIDLNDSGLTMTSNSEHPSNNSINLCSSTSTIQYPTNELNYSELQSFSSNDLTSSLLERTSTLGNTKLFSTSTPKSSFEEPTEQEDIQMFSIFENRNHFHSENAEMQSMDCAEPVTVSVVESITPTTKNQSVIPERFNSINNPNCIRSFSELQEHSHRVHKSFHDIYTYPSETMKTFAINVSHFKNRGRGISTADVSETHCYCTTFHKTVKAQLQYVTKW